MKNNSLANSKRLNCRAKCAECKRWCVWRATPKHPSERHSELFPFLCANCAKLFERERDDSNERKTVDEK